MPASRTVVIAGAGIGGLTAALAIARSGFPVTVLEAAERLEETGAGIQLSPNAARILIALGLGERLEPHVVCPQALRVFDARAGHVLSQAPLGAAAAQRYGAPYWVVHRGDLQTALREAVESTREIAINLGARVEEFAVHENGITVIATGRGRSFEAHGMALVAADGLWSALRRRFGHRAAPVFAHHTAWRTLVPVENVAPEQRAPTVNLWLGPGGHLVHYPVKGGSLINVVAILRDVWREPGWSAPGERGELLERFRADQWHASARDILGAGEHWQKWALYDCAPIANWGGGKGPVTLLGDAAHPTLPYLAQGAAMAIEDAAVLGHCLGRVPADPNSGLRTYERMRYRRTARVQRAARRNGFIYHLDGAAVGLRTIALRALGWRLVTRYDWLYGWKHA